MADLEKVIEGLGNTIEQLIREIDESQYVERAKFQDMRDSVVDALELMKKQKPVKPIIECYWEHTYGRCGVCKAPLPAIEGLKSKFCWMCGQAIKWDEPPKEGDSE